MTLTQSGIRNSCPYDLISGSISECPRFEPRVVLGSPHGTIITCAHARGSIARFGRDDGEIASFYSRCVLRSGNVEAERDFTVPLD